MTFTTRSNNTSFGYEVLKNLGARSINIAISSAVGSAYVGTESINICIRYAGIASDSVIIRLGQLQMTYYIKSIYGITPLGITQTVILNSDRQFGFVSGIPMTASEYSATITSLPVGFTVNMCAYKAGKIVCVMLAAKVFALAG
jgi:hypothetical protein